MLPDNHRGFRCSTSRKISATKSPPPVSGISKDTKSGHKVVEVFGFGQLGIQVQESGKNRLAAFKDGFMAQGGGDMGLAHSGRSDDHQVGRFSGPLGLQKLHDFISGDFGVESPVELFGEFNSFNAGLAQKMFDPFFFRSFCSSERRRCKKDRSVPHIDRPAFFCYYQISITNLVNSVGLTPISSKSRLDPFIKPNC